MNRYTLQTEVHGDIMTFFQNSDEVMLTVTEIEGRPGQGFAVYDGNGLDPETDEAQAPLVLCTAEDYGTLANAQRVAVQLAYGICLRLSLIHI